jgi:hypothetical protein
MILDYKSEMRRLNLVVAQNLARKKGGECLSRLYHNAKTHLIWQCSKGHRWKAVIGSIKFSGSWCPRCSSLKLHNKLRARRQASANFKLRQIAKSKGGSWIGGEFKGESHKLTWRCANGHEWKASPGTIRTGRWCPQCSTGRGERQARVAFEHLFGAKFPRLKPSWLLNSRGRRMELDGYNLKLQVAFEHQGAQHFEHNYYNLSKGSLTLRRQDDATKAKLCKERGVALLSIPEVGSRLKIEELEPFIRRWAMSKVPQMALNTNAVNYVDAYKDNTSSESLKKLQVIAEKRGGSCLDSHYRGSRVAHQFKCKEGHVWSAQPYEIRTGSWCFKCYHNSRGIAQRTPLLTLDGYAKSKGGKLVSRQSVGSRSKYEWECGVGHRWRATANSIQQGTWCPECRKLSELNLRRIAESNGGQLLDKVYNGAAKRMQWKCDKGHVWFAVGHRIAAGSWCPVCAGVVRPSIREMSKLAKARKGLCLSLEYIDAHTKLKWRCSKGHEWCASPSSIKRGSWCPSCSRERLSKVKRIGSVDVLVRLAARNGGLLCSTENMGSRVKHEWQCNNGHRWAARPTTVQQGHWCPKCAHERRLGLR